jgi:hypothetical protein
MPARISAALVGSCLLYVVVFAAEAAGNDRDKGVPLPANDDAVNKLVAAIEQAYRAGEVKRAEHHVERLQAMGIDALPGLLYLAIKSPDPLLRNHAVASIWRLDGPARHCTPILIDSFSKEKDRDVRLALIRTAKRINFNWEADYGWAKPHVKLLIRSLRDEEPMVIDDAVLILRGLRADARAAVPELIAVLGDDKMHNNCRMIIPSALAGIAPESNEVRQALRSALRNELLDTEAAKALEEIDRWQAAEAKEATNKSPAKSDDR